MTGAAGVGAVALTAACLVLVVLIVGSRAVRSVRRRFESVERPALESALAAYLADSAFEPLVPAGRRGRRLLRATALDALAELRGRERARLVGLLERLGTVAGTERELRSRSRLRRRRAADALALIGSEDSAAALEAGLHDPDAQVRLGCVRGLAALGAPERLPRLLAATEEAAEERPGAAAEVLLTLAAGDPGAVAELYRRTASAEVRRLAVAVLGELRAADHTLLLREALGSDDHELVARAARGLGLIGDADAVELLAELVSEGSRPWFVGAAAAKALGAIGDVQAVRALEWALRSPAWWVQANAAESLALLGAPGAEALRRAMESRRPSTRAHALVGLDS